MIETLLDILNNNIGMMEQTLSQIEGVTGSVEDNWGKIKETLLDILNNDIGKMEIAPKNHG